MSDLKVLEENFQKKSNTTTEMMVSRQAQEVQAAMVVAKKFPRDEYQAYERIIKACSRIGLAENAEYEYPRGGTKVSGPSIRLAEVLAQAWGNIDFGVIELEQNNGESTLMAYAWDLESNTRQTKIFNVKHQRKARGSINKLDDPRDVYELVANNGARRVRACILGIIPGDIVDAAVEKCHETVKNKSKEPLEDRVKKMISVFSSEFQVSIESLEKFIGCTVAAFTENDVRKLQGVYRSLKDNMAKREDYFEIPKPSAENPLAKKNDDTTEQAEKADTITEEDLPEFLKEGN